MNDCWKQGVWNVIHGGILLVSFSKGDLQTDKKRVYMYKKRVYMHKSLS